MNHLNQELNKVIEKGGEGMMLRTVNGVYRYDRCTEVLKVKKFHDAEAEVIGIEPGKGRLIGYMGALICKNKEGATFKVGSGFTDDQRRKPYPKIGSIITYQYFEVSKKGNPRFPTFMRFHPGV